MPENKSEDRQIEKFKRAARELGADGDEETLAKALRKMKSRPEKGEGSKKDES